MLTRPTTAQILEDCRRELSEVVAPAVTDPAVAISLSMLDEVLRNCAVRASHEIAWMHQESAHMVAYARDVLAAASDKAAIEDALDAYDAEARGSMHLDDSAADYSRAGQCLAEAIDVARREGHAGLLQRGRALLDDRMGHEEEIKGDWGFVGRG